MATFLNDEELTQEIKRQVSEAVKSIIDEIKVAKAANETGNTPAKKDPETKDVNVDGISDAVKAYINEKYNGAFKGKLDEVVNDGVKHYLNELNGETEEETLQNLDGVSPAVRSYINRETDKFKGKEI